MIQSWLFFLNRAEVALGTGCCGVDGGTLASSGIFRDVTSRGQETGTVPGEKKENHDVEKFCVVLKSSGEVGLRFLSYQ